MSAPDDAPEAAPKNPLAHGAVTHVALLFATGATGLMLYAATGTVLVQGLLALHLGVVLTFFVLLPYSKMAHGFYRMAALLREAQNAGRPPAVE